MKNCGGAKLEFRWSLQYIIINPYFSPCLHLRQQKSLRWQAPQSSDDDFYTIDFTISPADPAFWSN